MGGIRIHYLTQKLDLVARGLCITAGGLNHLQRAVSASPKRTSVSNEIVTMQDSQHLIRAAVRIPQHSARLTRSSRSDAQ